MSVGSPTRTAPPRAVEGSWAAELGPAFAGELRRRLPRLDAAARRLAARRSRTSATTLREIVAHAHALASSAVVMGEQEAARAGRACEHRLLAYLDAGAPPSAVVDDALGQLRLLLSELRRWCAEAPAAWAAPDLGPLDAAG